MSITKERIEEIKIVFSGAEFSVHEIKPVSQDELVELCTIALRLLDEITSLQSKLAEAENANADKLEEGWRDVVGYLMRCGCEDQAKMCEKYFELNNKAMKSGGEK